MEDNERGKSLVNVVPRGNNVLIRMEFKASILSLASGKPDKNSDEIVKHFVAGIGPQVKDLELDELVSMQIVEEYVDVPVDGNNNSIKSLTELYRTMKQNELQDLIKNGNNKADVIQYGIFPEFIIRAHI